MAFPKRRLVYVALGFLPIIPALFGSYLLDLVRPDPPMSLVADLGSRTMSVLENGEVVASYGIAIGRPSHPTPTGSFQTGSIIWNPGWTPPPSEWARGLEPRSPGDPRNPMQGVKIYFDPPYYFIHGTNDPGSIGEAASHGCIRMTEGDATALARKIQSAGGSVPLEIKG